MTYIPFSNNTTNLLFSSDVAGVSYESFIGKPNGVISVYPVSTISKTACINVGNFIYVFGGEITSTSQTTAYKYNLTLDTYSSIASLPTAGSLINIEAIDTNIYLFYGTTARKYDTVANTYTTLTSPPGAVLYTSTAIGQYIYVNGTASSGTALYRYDTVANSWSTLASIPVSSVYSYIFASDGTDVYMFSQNNSYKYLTSNNTFTSLANIASLGGSGWAYSAWDIRLYNQKVLYVSNEGSAKNKNKFFFNANSYESQSSQATYTHGAISYDITLNQFSRKASYVAGATQGYAAGPVITAGCGVKNSETIYLFNTYGFNGSSNTGVGTPSVYIAPRSSYVCTFNGLVSVYEAFSGSSPTKRIINETTQNISGYNIYAAGALNSSSLAYPYYKSGIPVKINDVINDLDNSGNTWGGTASSAIELAIIKSI